MDQTPGIADARIGRDEGRPELAIRVDRPKAALFGLTVTGVAETIRTNVAGTQAAMFREHGNEYPIIVRLREADREQVSDVEDVLVSTAQGQVLPAKNLMTIQNETGPTQIDRKTRSASSRSLPSRKARSARPWRPFSRVCHSSPCRENFRSASELKWRNRPRHSASCAWC